MGVIGPQWGACGGQVRGSDIFEFLLLCQALAHKVAGTSPSWSPFSYTCPEEGSFLTWKRCWSANSSPANGKGLRMFSKTQYSALHCVSLFFQKFLERKVLDEPFWVCFCFCSMSGWVHVPLRSTAALTSKGLRKLDHVKVWGPEWPHVEFRIMHILSWARVGLAHHPGQFLPLPPSHILLPLILPTI